MDNFDKIATIDLKAYTDFGALLYSEIPVERRRARNSLKEVLSEMGDKNYAQIAFLMFPILSRRDLELFARPVRVEKLYAWQVKARVETRCFLFESYGGLDEDYLPPTVLLKDFLTFTPNGKLICEDMNEPKVSECERSEKAGLERNKRIITEIPDGRFPEGKGPYQVEGSSRTFYYLGGDFSLGKNTGVQICSGPLNALASNCMSEVLLWVPMKAC